MDAARPFIARVEELVIQASTTLKQRAEIVWTVVRERLNGYIQSAIDRALQRVRGTIAIGGQEMRVAKVSVEQRLRFSTSLKASLEEICGFIAEGELAISAEYESKA